MEKKIKEKKKSNIIIKIIIVLLLIVFCFSLYKVIMWFVDNNKTSKVMDEINNLAEVNENDDSDKTEIVKQSKQIDENSPYWKYIKMKLINVNFNELKNKNSDTVGWIQVNGTNINYPFVKTTNNDYYLTHSFKKKANLGGWIFLDYRNNIKDIDKNTIIYGHGRLDTSMFGSLKNVFTNNWLKNSDNFIIKISTPYHNTLWQVFSVYKIPTTNDYIKVNFKNDYEFKEFYTTMLNRSQHNFNTNVTNKDKILTLSTCYNDNDKVVLHAKLIKKETK